MHDLYFYTVKKAVSALAATMTVGWVSPRLWRVYDCSKGRYQS
jgi:hypothetical protein